jgi:hypothetical protein
MDKSGRFVGSVGRNEGMFVGVDSDWSRLP